MKHILIGLGVVALVVLGWLMFRSKPAPGTDSKPTPTATITPVAQSLKDKCAGFSRLDHPVACDVFFADQVDGK